MNGILTASGGRSQSPVQGRAARPERRFSPSSEPFQEAA